MSNLQDIEFMLSMDTKIQKKFKTLYYLLEGNNNSMISKNISELQQLLKSNNHSIQSTDNDEYHKKCMNFIILLDTNNLDFKKIKDHLLGLKNKYFSQ